MTIEETIELARLELAEFGATTVSLNPTSDEWSNVAIDKATLNLLMLDIMRGTPALTTTEVTVEIVDNACLLRFETQPG